MKIYNAVVTVTAIAMTRNTLLCLKLYSSVEWETVSKPIKAQGEIKAIRMICLKTFASGIKAGLIDIPEPAKPNIEVTKQKVMPMVKHSTVATMIFAVAFLLFMQSKPTSHMTTSVTKASPRYTS